MSSASNEMSSRLIELEVKGENDGFLVPLEAISPTVPFSIKRVYYIYGVGEGLRRGFHAHKTLSQLLVCVSGRCVVDLDNSYMRRSFVLDKPNLGLIIDEPVWREMYDFSSDCVLMVLASEHYDPADYIHSFREYKAYVRKGKRSPLATSA